MISGCAIVMQGNERKSAVLYKGQNLIITRTWVQLTNLFWS
jgi:hypothetical protein